MGPESNIIAILIALVFANVLQLLIGCLRSGLLASERDEIEAQLNQSQLELNESQQACRALQFQLDCLSCGGVFTEPNKGLLQAITDFSDETRVHAWLYHLAQNRWESAGGDQNQTPGITLKESAIRKITQSRDAAFELSPHEFISRSRDGLHLESMDVFPCGNRQVLIVSQIPRITGNVERDKQLLSMVCQRFWIKKSHIGPRPTGIQESEDSHVKLELAREMLELRTLADHEFTSPHELLETFLARLAVLTGFARGSLYLLNEESETREFFVWGGEALSASDTEGWRHAEAAIIKEHHVGLQEALPVTPEMLSSHDIPFQAGLIAPAFHGEEEIGILLLTSREEYAPDAADLQLVHWAAEFIVQTLTKSLNLALIVDQARRDALTQLANRHAFEQEFSSIVQQASYLGHECSLVLMDIDFFKKINDIHGHPAGDAALRQVAQRISETIKTLRVTDRPLLARYGGEEFALLLPNVGESGAYRIAETIRQSVANNPTDFKGKLIDTTLSAGVATLPEHADSADELLSRADAALYRAKNNGRNRVEIAFQHQSDVSN